MKPTYQLISLSGSTNFLPINIAATTVGSATTIHTASSTDYDELWLYAYNYGNFDASLTLSIGGTSAFQQISQVIPASRGLIPVITGQPLTGGVIVKGFSSVTNYIAIIGRINRIVFI